MSTTVALLADLRRRGVALAAAGDKLRVRAPVGVLTDEDRAALAEHKQLLLALLADAPAVGTPLDDDWYERLPILRRAHERHAHGGQVQTWYEAAPGFWRCATCHSQPGGAS